MQALVGAATSKSSARSSGGSRAASAKQRAAAIAAAGAGQQLSASSVDGAGRQLQAATGRMVVVAVADAVAAAQRDQQAQQAQQVQQAPRTQRAKGKRWDALSLLLAPAAPLLAGLSAMHKGKEGESAGGSNKYDMLLDLLSSAAAAPGAQVGVIVSYCVVGGACGRLAPEVHSLKAGLRFPNCDP